MLKPGDVIDVWIVEKAIGSGGMGSVYRCRNKNSARILAAVKILDPSLIRQIPEVSDRFVREAEILHALDHPNVVKVRNLRLDYDPPFLEMEFVEGESLESRLCRGPLPEAVAIDLGRQLFSAIAYLHGRGVCHRDIKPSNLLIDPDGRLKLVDFGLAAEVEASRITRTNTTFGTVSYAPPEWIRPDELDPASWDLYACGVVLWELLTGRVAFPGSPQIDPRQQAVQIMTLKQSHPPLDPGGQFREDLRALIRDLTRADRSQRLRDLATARQRLDAVATTSEPVPPVRSATPPTVPRAATGVPRGTSGSTASEPSPRKKRARGMDSWAVLALGGVSGLGSFAVVLVLGLAVAWWALRGDATHVVDVRIAGLPRETPVGMRLEGADPVAQDGFVYRFADVAPGPSRLTWAIGEGCPSPDCPGAGCAAWCGVGEETLAIEGGSKPQAVNVELVAPQPRPVRVSAAAWPVRSDLSGDLGQGRAATVDGATLWFAAVAPGRYPLSVRAGVCTVEATDCASARQCPAGCGSVARELVVPPGEGAFEVVLDAFVALPAPEPAAEAVPAPVAAAPVAAAPVVARPVAATPATPPPVPVKSVPPPPVVPNSSAPVPAVVIPPSRPDSGSGAVRKSELAAWLVAHPDFASQWSASGTAGGAATGMTWALAEAFCKDRGGLAPLFSAPFTWTPGAGAPDREWRIDKGKAAWRRGDGATAGGVTADARDAATGFRCAR